MSLTAPEQARLLAELREQGCTCESVDVAVDREAKTIVIAHDAGCPCCPGAGSVYSGEVVL